MDQDEPVFENALLVDLYQGQPRSRARDTIDAPGTYHASQWFHLAVYVLESSAWHLKIAESAGKIQLLMNDLVEDIDKDERQERNEEGRSSP